RPCERFAWVRWVGMLRDDGDVAASAFATHSALMPATLAHIIEVDDSIPARFGARRTEPDGSSTKSRRPKVLVPRRSSRYASTSGLTASIRSRRASPGPSDR